MALESGHTLAHYEILEPIGKGGMGEVFRAKDTKLGRDVAIKVLPEELARDTERLARFRREAKVLASLNHANIAAIYGLEQSGDTHYLVLELVPGETLAERIARGPIPIDEAVVIAEKIGLALEKAHEQGIVHRDLKPANVKLTPNDDAKVLDFGLAKAFVEDTPDADSSMSPTITRDATRAGVILGTAAYMSPEQAKGKRVDRRADIWAFGAVLYEMLTGTRAFVGDDISDTLAAVLRAEPDWDALPASTPDALRTILKLCMTKDATLRVRDIGDVRLGMRGAFEGTSEGAAAASSRGVSWTAVAVAGLAAGLAVWFATRPEVPTPEPVKRFGISLSANLATQGGNFFALSRDGSELIYIGNGERGRQLFRKRADSLDVEPIHDTVDAARPFLSPDAAWLGFFSPEGLQKVSLSGGRPATICSDALCRNGPNRGGSWTPDGHIVIGAVRGGLSLVSAAGGSPETLTTAEDSDGSLYPVVMPSGRAVLFTIYPSAYEGARVATYSFATGEVRELFEGAIPRYAAGHIVYAREDALWAVAFDEETLTTRGDPFLLQDDVARPNTTVQFQVTDDELMYMPGSVVTSTVVWVDRGGRRDPIPLLEGNYHSVRVSPDGGRLLLRLQEADSVLWVYDIERATMSRIVIDMQDAQHPIWTPDGERVIFGASREGVWGLYAIGADGTGDVELLATEDGATFLRPHGWSRDGTTLLFSGLFHRRDGNDMDIRVLSLTGEPESVGLIATEVSETHPSVSPDGRWIAYTSELSGRSEVYVERFPDLGERRLISTEGGSMPVWSPDGKELFYMNLGLSALMVVPIDTSSGITAGNPEVLFEEPVFSQFSTRTIDIAPDGERFVLLTSGSARAAEDRPPPSLVVVQNWLSEH